MAKGFTVKAKNPTKKEPSWDIPTIKENSKVEIDWEDETESLENPKKIIY